MDGTSFGLQWKLTAVFLAVSAVAAGMTAAGHFAATALGLTPASAWGAGLAAGFLSGLVVSVIGFLLTRTFKRRLWDAGDMANRMAAGDFGIRLDVRSDDEIGWLEQQLNAMAQHLERAVGDLRLLAEQNRRLAEEAGRGAALEERARLARDLHDTVNQQLFVLAMRAAAARKRLEKLGVEAVQPLVPEMATLEELARQAHGEARQLILQLRPTTLEQQGLGPALAEYVQSAAAKEGWQVTDRIDRTVRLDGRPGENLFRVAQEALNNISKHAGATLVEMVLEHAGDGVLLAVRDNGQGFDMRAGVRPTAVGLIGMQERVEAMGGTLRVKSARGRDTEIEVRLPVRAEGGDSA